MPDLSVFTEYLISTAAAGAFTAAACALKRRLRAYAERGGPEKGNEERS